MILRSTFAIAAATLMIATGPAHAAPVNETPFDATINHDDLDLATSEGAARLDERVRIRIRQLCQNGGRDGASLRLERECRMSALADAGHKIRVAIANARVDRVRLAQNTTASPAATPGV